MAHTHHGSLEPISISMAEGHPTHPFLQPHDNSISVFISKHSHAFSQKQPGIQMEMHTRGCQWGDADGQTRPSYMERYVRVTSSDHCSTHAFRMCALVPHTETSSGTVEVQPS